MVSNGSVPADENVVRRNTTPVEADAPPAEQSAAPDFNEVTTDANPNLGLEPRQLASHVIPTEKYRPAWIEDVDAQHLHNDLIDRQVSSSGTAAARENAGIFGHGTLMVTEGIEPVQDLRDGGKFGNEYFTRHERVVQEGMGDYMSAPPGMEQSTIAMVAATGKSAAQVARESAMYSAYLNGTP
jgi:hypothetical protein